MAIAQITVANLLTKLSVTSVTGLDSIQVTLTAGNEATELASLLTAFNNHTAPMLIGVGLQVKLADGTVLTFSTDSKGAVSILNGSAAYTGSWATNLTDVFSAFSAARLPSIPEINTKLTTDLAGAIHDISVLQTAVSDLPAIKTAIGAPDDISTTNVNEATGLYKAISDAVATAVTNLATQINDVVSKVATNTDNIKTNTGDIKTNTDNIKTNTDSIASLKAALIKLDGVVDSNNTAIGTPASGSGSTVVAATGLYATIDNAVATAVAGVKTQINTLVNDAVSGAQPSTDSIAGLKAALAALTTVVGTASAGQTAATGLTLTIEGLTAQVTELGSALTAGYTAAKAAYDASVTAAATSKGLADTALAAYNTAAANVIDTNVQGTAAAKAQIALKAAQDYYAKAILAKTDADNLVAKANTVTIASAQTPSTADDTVVASAQTDALTAQTTASNTVVMASGDVNAASIVLSNATLDASNGVIVTFIDYSSAAAATISDTSAATTAKNSYDAALVTFNNAQTLNNANALKTAADTFNTAALKAQTTAIAAVTKAAASSASAATTSSTADDTIATTNATTAGAAKSTADELVAKAATDLAYATALTNVPTVTIIDAHTFTVTAGAAVTATGTALDTTFTKTAATGTQTVDTYTANTSALDGTENIVISATRDTLVGSTHVISVPATSATSHFDSIAPAAPSLAVVANAGASTAAEATDGSVTVSAETGSSVAVTFTNGLHTVTKTISPATVSAQAVALTTNDLTTLGDGTISVTAQATDAAGNQGSASNATTFVLDTLAPTTPIISTIAGDNIINATEKTPGVAIAGTAEAGSSVAVTLDGVTQTVTADSTTFASGNIPADTTSTNVSVVATDAAGNHSTAATQAIAIDTVAPTVTITTAPSAVNGSTTATITFTFSEVPTGFTWDGTTGDVVVTGGALSAVTQDSQNSKVYTATFTPSTNTEANASITVTAAGYTDAAGNNGTAGATPTLAIDTLAPTAVATITALSADTEASGATNGTDFNTKTAAQTVSGTYAGTLGSNEKIQVSVDGTTWVDATVTPEPPPATPDPTPANGGTWTAGSTVTLLTGNNTLSVHTIDAAGNVTAGTGHTYTLDQTPPTVTVSGIGISTDTGTSSTDFITKTAGQTISATLSAALANNETLWGSVDSGLHWVDITSKVSSTDPKTAISWDNVTLSGSNSIQFQVRDIAGNAGTTATQAYTLDTSTVSATASIDTVTDNVGAIQGDMIANSRTATDDTSLALAGTITGTMNTGDLVVIYDGATRLGTATISGSAWTYTDSTLTNGHITSYTAKVENAAGTQGSASSPAFAASITTTAPTTTASIDSVTDNVGTFTGSLISGGVTDDTSLDLAGTLTATLGVGEVLAVYDGTTRLGNATVSGSGWTYTDATLANGDTPSYTVVVENTAVGIQGMASTAFTTTIDTLAPAAPTIALAQDTGSSQTDLITNNTALTVSTLEAGATRSYVVDTGSASGTYTAPTTNGSHTVTVTDTDTAGNVSTTGSITFTLDITAPAAPTAVTLTSVGGTVVSNTLNTTNTDLTATASITAGEATGGKAELYIGSTLVATDSAIAIGDTSVAFDVGTASNTALQAVIAAGGVATVRLYDLVGNVVTSSVSNPSLTVDYVAPTTPTVTLTTDSGTLATDNYTNDASLTFSTLEAGATRSYVVDGGTASVTYTAPTTDGSHTVAVTDTDAAGNVSTSGSITFTLDKTAAAPVISGLTTDTGATGVAGVTTDKITSNTALTMTGVENGAVVEYSVDSGSWIDAATYANTADGAHSVTVRQTDKAGNVSAASNAFTFTKDTTAPAAATFTVNDNGVVTSDGITSDANVAVSLASDTAKWEYTLDGSNWVAGTGTSFSLGSSTATFALGSIGVKEYDAAGNTVTTYSTKAYTLDLTPPAAAATPVLYVDGGGDATNHYQVSDTIVFKLNETVQNSATLVSVSNSHSLGDAASFAQTTDSQGFKFTLDSGSTLVAGDVVTIAVIDLVGNTSNVAFTLA
jgi:hypothetical protein